MKILRLNIENIASIEKAEVDFERAPLAGDSLFLITGSTGAGKSSILDAMCLALYGRTPRLSNSSNKKNGEVIGIANAKGTQEDVLIDSVANLFRRGTNHASASLLFEGADGCLYKSCWQMKRGPRTKQLCSPERTLFRFPDGNEDGEAQQIDVDRKGSAVESAVGLSFDQFCKTTLLAQGDFTKFLKSSPDEKSAILENITGTEVYSRISIEVNNRFKAAKHEYDAVKEKLADDARKPLSPQELQELKDARDRAEAAVKEAAAEQKVVDDKLKWLTDDARLKARQTELAAARAAAREAVNKPEFIAKKRDVALWDRTENVRAFYRSRTDNESSLADEKGRAEEMKAGYMRCLAMLAAHDASLAQKQQELDKLRLAMQPLDPHAPMFEQKGRLDALLDALVADQKTISDEKKKCEELTPKLAQIEAAQQAKLTKAESLKKEIETQEALLEQKRASLNELCPMVVDEVLANVRDAIAQHAKVKNAQENVAVCGGNVADLDNNISSWQTRLATIEPELVEAQNKKTSAQKLYDETCETFGAAMNILRRHKEGDECPVCGGVIKNIKTNEAFETALRPLAENKDAATALFEKKLKEQSEAKTTLCTLEKQHSAAVTRWQEAQTTLATLQKQFANQFAKCHMEAEAADVAKAAALLEEKKALLEKTSRDIANLRQEIDALGKKNDETQRQRNAVNEECQRANEELLKIKNAAKLSEKICENAAGDIKQKNAEVASLVSYSDGWDPDDPVGLKKRLEQDSKLFDEQTKGRAELEKDIEQMQKELVEMDGVRQKVLAVAPRWAGLTVGASAAATPAAHTDVLARWHAFNNQVNVWVDRLKQLKQSIDGTNKKIDDFFVQTPDVARADVEVLIASHTEKTIGALRAEVQALVQKDALTQNSVDELAKELEKHKSAGTSLFDPAAEPADALALQNRHAHLQQQTSELNRSIGSLAEQISAEEKKGAERIALQKEFDQKSEVYNKWDVLNKFLGSDDGKKFRTMAQSIILGELLHHANHHLRQLTGSRFTLECGGASADTASGLTIFARDAYNGNTPMAASSLSGGESFMVSLALALGLASFSGARQTSADILFIDEGFGTLDAECLEKVMALLERLRETGGRRVGIISHVDDLKERIRAQIIVEKKDNCRSFIRIKG